MPGLRPHGPSRPSRRSLQVCIRSVIRFSAGQMCCRPTCSRLRASWVTAVTTPSRLRRISGSRRDFGFDRGFRSFQSLQGPLEDDDPDSPLINGALIPHGRATTAGPTTASSAFSSRKCACNRTALTNGSAADGASSRFRRVSGDDEVFAVRSGQHHRFQRAVDEREIG